MGKCGRWNRPLVWLVVTRWLTIISFTSYENAAVRAQIVLTSSPPRGWNSYDSFSWLVTEDKFLDNAEYAAQNLLQFGFEYVVVDFLWFRKIDGNATFENGEDLVDEWGRPQPDPQRWPSSVGGNGFKIVAQKVHSMGLKFGIHVMRGISSAALRGSTPILGVEQGSQDGPVTAKDIALMDQPCPWMPSSFFGINASSSAGAAFIQSLYQQFADWGVDYVKHDCVFGNDLQLGEIQLVLQAIANTGRSMVYSLSPGNDVTMSLAKDVGQLVNLYRVTRDVWDTWEDLLPHFDVASSFAGAGLLENSWPDLDMLPLGWLTDPGANLVAYRKCNLTFEEQKTMLTLWAMAKSPLMYGGDLRMMDTATLHLLTNRLMLYINSNSIGNREVVLESTLDKANTRMWVARGPAGETFLAVFNLGWRGVILQIPFCELYALARNGQGSGEFSQCVCSGLEVWTSRTVEIQSTRAEIYLPIHGCTLVSISCTSATQSPP